MKSLKPEEIITDLVDYCIKELYTAELDIVNKKKIEKLEIDTEAINWGDLHCVRVEKGGELYIAYIEEASPNCPNLVEYIESALEYWGWNIKIITEW